MRSVLDKPETPEATTGSRKRYLMIPAVLVAYGIWRYTGLRYNVDVSGVHYHCQTIWNTLVSGKYPENLGVIDAGSRGTLSDSQIWDLANRACHQDASDSAFMNALWLVPAAYWPLLNICRWFIRDVDGPGGTPAEEPATVRAGPHYRGSATCRRCGRHVASIRLSRQILHLGRNCRSCRACHRCVLVGVCLGTST